MAANLQRVRYSGASFGAAFDGGWIMGAGVQDEQRYGNNIYHKTVKERNQGFALPSVKVLQKKQSRVKASKRKFKAKRRVPRTVPRAPFNDSSFLMRVRRTGGLAPPSSRVVPSPAFSNLDLVTYRDFLDHEDYGYGSMAGLIRLRGGEGEEEKSCTTVVNSLDDVNMCGGAAARNLEQRLDRFEMADLPARGLEVTGNEESRIRELEDENLVLQGRLVLIQQEVNDLRERLQRGSGSDMVREDGESTQSCLDS